MAIEIPNYGATHINFYCTIHSVQQPGHKPTVWFEGSSSQGVTDFLGIQHYLLDHDISSCSYDPPSFGGSDVMPTKMKDHSLWLPALFDALNQSPIHALPDNQQNHTYVGWGSTGTKLAVQHALNDKNASGIITLDPMLPEAESLVEQAKHKWSDAKTRAHYVQELTNRIYYQSLALSFGIGWYGDE
jgi:hypothetical protein